MDTLEYKQIKGGLVLCRRKLESATKEVANREETWLEQTKFAGGECGHLTSIQKGEVFANIRHAEFPAYTEKLAERLLSGQAINRSQMKEAADFMRLAFHGGNSTQLFEIMDWSSDEKVRQLGCLLVHVAMTCNHSIMTKERPACSANCTKNIVFLLYNKMDTITKYGWTWNVKAHTERTKSIYTWLHYKLHLQLEEMIKTVKEQTNKTYVNGRVEKGLMERLGSDL